MQQQYTLVERPVILSENRQNVIPHGRPLTPIGTVRSARPFFVPRQVKGSFTEEKHGDSLSLKSSLSGTSSISLIEYHRNVNENLMNINNNLSLMLKESFAGIDSICQKVRLCLLDANTIKIPENTEPLTSIKERENLQVLSICEEEADSSQDSNENITDLPVDLEENVAEIVEINEAEQDNNMDEQEEDEITEKPKRTPSITPFFTILNPKTQSAESVGVTMIKSMSSKLAISRKRTAESFNKTMREVEKLTDYEQFLTSMVEGINKQIEQCYAGYPKSAEGKTRNDNDKSGPKITKKNEGKKVSRKTSSKTQQCNQTSISAELKRYHEVRKIQRDLMEDQFSENDLSRYCKERRYGISIYAAKMDFTCPDVYRKRAITDLHKRLEAQVEANDSLIFFQKLMAKNKKHMTNSRPRTEGSNNLVADSNTIKSAMQYLLPPKQPTEEKKQCSLTDLTKKYQDSLWFRQKKHELKRSKKEPMPRGKKRVVKKEKKNVSQSYTIESSVGEGNKSNRNVLKITQPEKESTPPKKRRGKKTAVKKEKKTVPQSSTIESSVNEGNKPNTNGPKITPPGQPVLESACNCHIKITNDQPLSEAQKCKLHWMRAKYSQLSHKRLKYLNILDDITKNDLLPIKAEYPRRDQIKSIGVKDSYLYKLIYGKNQETQSAWEQLFQPSTKCSQENCGKCSATTLILNKPDDHKESRESNYTANDTIPEKLEPPVHDLERGDIIRKLSKYIFFEAPQPKIPKPVFTVMPVHVFYDNLRSPPDNSRRNTEEPQKLPLIPMKETKEYLKKAEWNDAMKKTKPMRVVYDPILRKIEKEIRLIRKSDNKGGTPKVAQTNSWSPKSFSQYCSPSRQPAAPRTLNVKIDSLGKKKKISIASNRPQQIAEIFKRSPKPSAEKMSHLAVSSPWNSPTLDPYSHQKDTGVKQKIEKTITTEANSRMKSEQQRKIWENKYGKSVGQKLINFIEKQPVLYQAPVPKYALPKGSAKEQSRQQAMLEQLRNLKQKNDNIQTNIQKAIQVIENKMVDILSKPTTSESIEAFDAMEKEITSVLSLMKSSNTPKSGNRKEKPGKNDEYGSDNYISDELFRRLDRILESPGKSSSGISSNSLTKEEIIKRKNNPNQPPKSTDMNQVCFSSTSASGEEKFTITAISPKRAYKNPTIPPFIKTNIKANAAIPEDVSTITSELRKLENELKLQKSREKLNQQVNQANTTNVSESVDETEPVKENLLAKKSSIIKKRKIIPEQQQVVNLAICHQNNQERSAGDQLQELKKLLENDLKSLDGSDEVTHSMGPSFSQGDYEIQNAIKIKNEEDSKEKVSDSTDVDIDSVLGEKEEVSTTTEEKKKSGGSPKPTEDPPKKRQEPTEKKTPDLPITKKSIVPVNWQEPTVVKQVSQQSLDVTGPYFTPQTSPLDKIRHDDDQKPCSPIAEEEKQPCEDQQAQAEQTCKDGDVQRSPKKDEQKDSQMESGKNVSKQNGHEEKEKQGRSFVSEDNKSETSEKDDFYENVNKIISRVESVYNQLEEFETEMLMEEQKYQSITGHESVHKDEPHEAREPETVKILTPLMHAFEDLRKTASECADSRKSSPRMNRSPSLFNVLSFLDNLADIKKERAVEVYTPRICYSSYVVQIPQTFYQSTILHQVKLSPPPVITEAPKKKAGCLKNPSNHLNINSVPSKSRQKVSFLLEKEEKWTQVTSCPFHSVARILSKQKMSGSPDTSESLKKDEQVSAYLDACENKSVDKMSLTEDDETYQSTLEVSDEMSSDKPYQMPEQVVQNLQESLEKEGEKVKDNKKNVVEIFRNSLAEENRPGGIKVFTEKTHWNEVRDCLKETDKEGVKVPLKEVDKERVTVSLQDRIREEVRVVSGEQDSKRVKVFYDDFNTGKEDINSKLVSGFYNEKSISQVQDSLGKNLMVKKRDSLEKLLKSYNQETLLAEILKEASLFEPLKNLNTFVDSKLLKEVVEKRQAIRMMRRKSSFSGTSTRQGDKIGKEAYRVIQVVQGGEKENLLKGFYVFVYLLMFTALNLEYKCVQ